MYYEIIYNFILQMFLNCIFLSFILQFKFLSSTAEVKLLSDRTLDILHLLGSLLFLWYDFRLVPISLTPLQLFFLSLLDCSSHVSRPGPTGLLYDWQQACALIRVCSCREPEADIDNIHLTANVSVRCPQ